MAAKELILVTGGTGFLGSHCILQALQKGYRVRTTIRSLKRSDAVKQMMRKGGASEDAVESIEFTAADLSKDEGWADACKDCAYVLHVASPFPPQPPKNEDELITPAKQGTLRVLQAAKASGTVKRVVVTSSSAAVVYGQSSRGRDNPFTEKDWTKLDDPSIPVAAYQKSKTLAERAAWDWIAKEGNGLELAVVNPVGIFGPLLSSDYPTSIEIVVALLNRMMPGVPNVYTDTVDVRDTADLHFRAMLDPKAAGERFIACNDEAPMTLRDIGIMLKAKYPGKEAERIPTRQIPNVFVRLTALFNPLVSLIVPELGVIRSTSNAKAKTVLGWQPRSAEESILDSAKTCKEFGLLK